MFRESDKDGCCVVNANNQKRTSLLWTDLLKVCFLFWNIDLAATEATPEERAKKELRDRMKQEYLAAISHEGKE